jgi:spore maturation protein CgeB
MNIAFFGSSLVSAYWNGAATYYRGIIRALHERGWHTTFYEPDAFERQAHRDLADPPWARVWVYPPTEAGAAAALRDARRADLVVKASGVGVLDEFLEAAVLELQAEGRLVAYWDVDAPATLERMGSDPQDPLRAVIGRYDLVFTYGGGAPVVSAYRDLGALHCVPVYNALDPETHHPAPVRPGYVATLGFLGNRLPDRERRVDEFFFAAAHALPQQGFVLGGSGWQDRAMPRNVNYVGHVYTGDHNAFNSSCTAVLNINRDSMARFGFSPPTRVFEAAGAAACLICDAWPGIEEFLEPEREVLVARSGAEVAAHLAGLTPERARQIGVRARARILAAHTYRHRAAQVIEVLGGQRKAQPAGGEGRPAAAVPDAPGGDAFRGDASAGGGATGWGRICAFSSPGAPAGEVAAARPMRIVMLGLSLSSSWGNGHATTYRALIGALRQRGHQVLFLERDVPWYAAHRDLDAASQGGWQLYRDLANLQDRFGEPVTAADLVIVGSYVPDGVAVARWVCRVSRGVKAFYDIDTPVTLAKLEAGDEEYLSRSLIPAFDLYLSFSGGPILEHLQEAHGARAAHPFYCSVDPVLYAPAPVEPQWDLGYLGTYSVDRQPALDELLIAAARRWPQGRFVVAGPQYPESISWPANVRRRDHVAASEHRTFYGQMRFTLNVTRRQMVNAGFSPSVRLFEAAACGVPIVSDRWAGLESLFEPGREILIPGSAAAVVEVVRDMPEEERRAVAERARARVLSEHTAEHRARQLEEYVHQVAAASKPAARTA